MSEFLLEIGKIFYFPENKWLIGTKDREVGFYYTYSSDSKHRFYIQKTQDNNGPQLNYLVYSTQIDNGDWTNLLDAYWVEDAQNPDYTLSVCAADDLILKRCVFGDGKLVDVGEFFSLQLKPAQREVLNVVKSNGFGTESLKNLNVEKTIRGIQEQVVKMETRPPTLVQNYTP